jgi:thymidylate synthase
MFPNFSQAEYFNKLYPFYSSAIIKQKPQGSRAGETHETLHVTTMVNEPIKRCVGGTRRGINIFFLLAEAIWIWCGKKDLKSLTRFNKGMAQYSDDGVDFHGAYGHRIRHAFGVDQIKETLELLSNNPDTRRAVISIWNPQMDLNAVSKDIPCNDMLMFKVREGELHLSVHNRSNDLHWGLTTNFFQFSFILETMASILGLRVGTETHFSDSLHAYVDNPLTYQQGNLDEESDGGEFDLYDEFQAGVMFPVMLGGWDKNLQAVDQCMDYILKEIIQKEPERLKHESPYILQSVAAKLPSGLRPIALILHAFAMYDAEGRSEGGRLRAINRIWSYYMFVKKQNERQIKKNIPEDYFALAFNWFITRLKKSENLSTVKNLMLEGQTADQFTKKVFAHSYEF